MAGPLKIRLATPTDVPAINDIYNHYVLHSTATYQLEPTSVQERMTWFEQHNADHPITVAESSTSTTPPGGKPLILGWGSLAPYRPRKAYRFTVENSVYIHPDYHRQGIGRAIMVDLIARARASGFHAMIAAISADQLPSVKLHEALGFKPAGQLREVGWKFDRWLDVAYLQLML